MGNDDDPSKAPRTRPRFMHSPCPEDLTGCRQAFESGVKPLKAAAKFDGSTIWDGVGDQRHIRARCPSASCAPRFT